MSGRLLARRPAGSGRLRLRGSAEVPQVLLSQRVERKQFVAAVGEVPMVPSVAGTSVGQLLPQLMDRPNLLAKSEASVRAQARRPASVSPEEEGLADRKATVGNQFADRYSRTRRTLPRLKQFGVVGRRLGAGQAFSCHRNVGGFTLNPDPMTPKALGHGTGGPRSEERVEHDVPRA